MRLAARRATPFLRDFSIIRRGFHAKSLKGIRYIEDAQVPNHCVEMTNRHVERLFSRDNVILSQSLLMELSEAFLDKLKYAANLGCRKSDKLLEAVEKYKSGEIDVIYGSIPEIPLNLKDYSHRKLKTNADKFLRNDVDEYTLTEDLPKIILMQLINPLENLTFMEKIQNEEKFRKGVLPFHNDFIPEIFKKTTMPNSVGLYCINGYGEVQTYVVNVEDLFNSLDKKSQEILGKKMFFFTREPYRDFTSAIENSIKNGKDPELHAIFFRNENGVIGSKINLVYMDKTKYYCPNNEYSREEVNKAFKDLEFKANVATRYPFAMKTGQYALFRNKELIHGRGEPDRPENALAGRMVIGQLYTKDPAENEVGK